MAQTTPSGAKANPPLKVLIVGGGVAGPVTAFWLSRLGHDCTIIERYPGLRVNGLQIDVHDAGAEAARRMGVLDEIRRRRVEEEGTKFVDVEDRVQAVFGRNDGNKQTLTSEYEIMRGDLCKLLYERTEEKVKYRFGVTIEDFKNGIDGVTVTLSDGTVERFDLLVGADGQGSRVRRLMLHQNAEASYRRLNAFCCYFTMPREPEDKDNMAAICHVPGQRFIMTRWHTPSRGQTYLFTMGHTQQLREALTKGVEAERQAFTSAFADAGWKVPRLLRDMQTAEDFYGQELVQVVCPNWSLGRVVLVGDAGYAPSPFTGMGTSLAFIGAYVLAGEIASHPGDLAGAFAAYDRTLRPMVEKTQKLPPGFPGAAFQQTGLKVGVLHWTVWLMSGMYHLALALRLPDAFSAIGNLFPGKEWKLPVYEELEAVRPKDT